MEIRQVVITAALLATFTVAGVTLVALTRESTVDRIESNEREMMLARISAVLKPGSYDNDPVEDRFVIVDPAALGWRAGFEPVGYRARLGDRITSVVLPVNAPEGYGGDINLLVGVTAEGVVSGVRVTRHRETPGLGDPIEAEKSDWILGFEGKSLDNPQNGWAVRKDGGQFDQFTGATITPRAVVNGVYRALQYARDRHAQLFGLPGQEVVLPADGTKREKTDE
ncbi:MAG: electron transport complex subunit RsxG [Halothiobacillaceae bacterium]